MCYVTELTSVVVLRRCQGTGVRDYPEFRVRSAG